jgi:integrase
VIHGKLCAVTSFNARPDRSVLDRLLVDGDGLSLRIRANGTRTWMIDDLFEGKGRRFTIGILDKQRAAGERISSWLENGRLSLAQARAIAGQWKADRLGGRDQIAEWEAQNKAKREALESRRRAEAIEAAQPAVREAAELFAVKQRDGKKSAPAVRYRLECLVNRKLRDLARKDIIMAPERIAEGQVEGHTAKQLAGEVLIRANRLWRFAALREWVPASCIESRSRKDIDAWPNRRTAALRLDELAMLWRVLCDRSRCTADPISVAALKLIILTGQCEREVTDAQWIEFDVDAGIWRIPAVRTKSNRTHLIHLAPQAIAIINEMKSINGKRRHVFASPLRKDQAIFGRSVNNSLGMMFKRGLLPNVTPCHVHDLRRTLITRLPDLGIEPFIGHKITNHVLPGVLGHYNHNEYLTQREAALHAWATRIEVLAADNKVVQFQRPAA